MKKYMLYLICCCCLACTQTAQQQATKQEDPFGHISNVQVRKLLQKSIATHGGWDTWNAKTKLRYTKDFSLLTADGVVEKKFEQEHVYEYQPLSINIRSTENGQVIQTVLKDDNYTRTQDAKALDIPKDKLQKAINTSLYVIGIPFKLLDAGAVINYLGTDTILNQSVDVLEVRYDAEQYSNHSTSDIWRYYFDRTDGKVLANWVQTNDHANLIENVTFERVGGILFNKERKSWRLDSLGNKAYLRADYVYDNFELD